MKGIARILLLLTIGFLTASALLGQDRPCPIKWTVGIYSENTDYIEVRLTVLDGFAVKPELPFNVVYFDQNSNVFREFKAGFFDQDKVRERKPHSSYTRRFYIGRGASEIKGGLMHYTVIGRPRPYSSTAPASGS